jgi:hypothetical protein
VLGDRHVAVAIAETSDSTALSAADQGTLRAAWQDDVSDGRMVLVNAGVVGPIRLTGNWATYANDVNTGTGQTDGWEAFGRAVVADLRAQNEAAAAAGQPPVEPGGSKRRRVRVRRSSRRSGRLDRGGGQRVLDLVPGHPGREHRDHREQDGYGAGHQEGRRQTDPFPDRTGQGHGDRHQS